jgi:hypothetical protein
MEKGNKLKGIKRVNSMGFQFYLSQEMQDLISKVYSFHINEMAISLYKCFSKN